MFAETVRLITNLSERRPSGTLPSRLNVLFQRLGAADPAVSAVEDEIWSIWMYHPHRAAATALDRAASDIAAQRFDIAETRLARLVRGCPDYPEAWHKRATLHYVRAHDVECVRDLHRTLELEPRHFGALMSFGEICLSANRPEIAMLAFNAALRIHPTLEAAREGLARASDLQ